MMSANVAMEASRVLIGETRALFQTRTGSARFPYAVTADGQRFLVATVPEEATGTPINIVVNWPALIDQGRR